MTAVAPYDDTRARVGEPAPDFALPRVGGGMLRLSDLRGKPVVVNFFASWCHPCEQEMPVLEGLHREYGERLAVVGVNYRDAQADTRAFVERLGVTYPTLIEDDGSNPVAGRYGVRSPPMTYFVAADGTIAAPPVYGGATRADLEPSLTQLLGHSSQRK
jgi:cytochrome c biogenesis protein CcmG/thiol:disulfide interchange protein DsbE